MQPLTQAKKYTIVQEYILGSNVQRNKQDETTWFDRMLNSDQSTRTYCTSVLWRQIESL